MIRGECQFGSAGFEQVLKSHREGKSLTAFLLLSRSPMLTLAGSGRRVPPRGGGAAEKVAVPDRNEAAGLLARYLTAGLPVAAGDENEVSDAFRKRRFSLAVLDAIRANQLEVAQSPMLVLADTRTLAGVLVHFGVSHYPASCVFVQTAFVAGHDDQLRRVARALTKALDWIRRHNATDCVGELPEGYRNSADVAALEMAVDQIRPLFSTDGVIPADGAEAVRKVLAASDERFRGDIVPPGAFTREFLSGRE